MLNFASGWVRRRCRAVYLDRKQQRVVRVGRGDSTDIFLRNKQQTIGHDMWRVPVCMVSAGTPSLRSHVVVCSSHATVNNTACRLHKCIEVFL